ncbi:MAG: MarR family transcriptional regulator [Actinomycetota bacterium]
MADRCPSIVNDDRIVVAGLLSQAHHMVTRALSSELEERSGMGLTTYEALVRLRRSDDGRLTMGELGRQLGLTSGYVTRLVDRLCEEGFAERQNCPNDRRAFHIALSPAGLRALDEATDIHLEQLDGVLESLSCDERRSLAALLSKLAATSS